MLSTKVSRVDMGFYTRIVSWSLPKVFIQGLPAILTATDLVVVKHQLSWGADSKHIYIYIYSICIQKKDTHMNACIDVCVYTCTI